MRKVIIEPVLNGFRVKVGCGEVVFMDIDVLCSELKRYHLNPELVEKEYMASAINHPMTCEVERGLEQPPLSRAERLGEIPQAGQESIR